MIPAGDYGKKIQKVGKGYGKFCNGKGRDGKLLPEEERDKGERDQASGDNRRKDPVIPD
jgi:hypothetical protein